jgi:anti-sigma factor RsiW
VTHTTHLEELAELYAIGALPDDERAAADAHIAECAACARRVGEAEETVASLSAANGAPSPQLERRMRAAFIDRGRTRSWYPFVAAAFILGLLPSIALLQRDRNFETAGANRNQALAAMVHSHFLHAPFVKIAPDAPAAKAIFARDGSWLYVIAASDRDLTLTAGGRVLGTVTGNGGERTLFLVHPPHAKALDLSDGSRTLARAAIALP